MTSPISQAIKQICDEKNISFEAVLETIEAALASAYRKDFGEKNQNIKVQFDPETSGMRVFDVKTVVEDMELPPDDEAIERLSDREIERTPSLPPTLPPTPVGGGEIVVEEKKFNPKIMIMISEAQKVKPDAEIGEEIRTELEVPGAFGRMAAQTAKQVIMQRLREAEREVVFNEYKGREGEVIVATVQRHEGRAILIDLGRATGIMLPDDQAPHERYSPGERLKVYVSKVSLTTKGPEILVSRTNPELVRKLFAQEIPEVSNGAVEIRTIAREAGSRTKVAVMARDAHIDPIGSCIGQRGTRIQTVTAELGGEKIDVIAWDEDPRRFIANALSPAKVAAIDLREDEKVATARVPREQLSLAIGKGGQNVRLAARLSGWKISVVEAEAPAGEEVVSAEAEPETKPEPEIKPEPGTE